MISLNDYINNQINENKGIYNGCKELCELISKTIKDNKHSFFIIEGNKLNFDNIFFKHLIIYVNYEKLNEELLSATYHIDNINNLFIVKHLYNDIFNWDYENKIFNYIEISLETTKDRIIDDADLCHELNHCYEDYNIRKNSNNEKTINDYINNKYNDIRNLFVNGQYSDKIVSFIEYISIGTETRAFVSQATYKFKENLDKYSNFDEAIKWQFENNKIFQNFVYFKNLFNKNKAILISKKFLCKSYRKIYKYSKDSDDKIIKILENKLDKFYNALTKHINIILSEYAKENN